MTLYFHNPGEIDIRGATIMGLNAKEQPDTAIGFFGTGLKYSIASILRWKGSIQIHSGNTVFCFAAEDMTFREKEFQRVVMSENVQHNEPLGFTTEYGKKWQAWQVFRELLANARDEHGDVSNHYVAPAPGTTVIVVNCPILEAEFPDRNRIILPLNHAWDFSSDNGRLLAQPAESVYYRDVRVLDRTTALTYNITKDLTLTEDRTVKSRWELSNAISRLLAECTEREAILIALSSEDGMEHDLEFNVWHEYSTEFLDVAAELYQQAPRKHKRLREVLEKHRPESTIEQEVELSAIRQLMLARAIKLVDKMGMPASTSTIKVVELGSDTLGQYRAATGYIYLDPKVFEQGTKQVVATLYEELLHKTAGLEDCTYAMQTHLFNLIVSLHEEHVFKEPC